MTNINHSQKHMGCTDGCHPRQRMLAMLHTESSISAVVDAVLALFVSIQLLRKVVWIQTHDHGQGSFSVLTVWTVLAGVVRNVSSYAVCSTNSH